MKSMVPRVMLVRVEVVVVLVEVQQSSSLQRRAQHCPALRLLQRAAGTKFSPTTCSSSPRSLTPRHSLP